MRSPWITITFLAFAGISIGAPVADAPYFDHNRPHVDAHTHHGAAVVDIGTGHAGIHIHTKAKAGGAGDDTVVIGRSPQGGLSNILGALTGSAGPQPGMNNAPQGASPFLTGLLPLGAPAGQGPGAGAPARRSPQGLSSLLGSILGSQPSPPTIKPAPTPSAQRPNLPNIPLPPIPQVTVPTAPPVSFTPSPSPPQANPILPRSPQDFSKLLGIVFPAPPAPAPADGSSDSSDSSNNRREPQLSQVTSLVTSLVAPPAPAPRRWLVNDHAASEASSDVETDSTRKHHKSDHAEHHAIKVAAGQGVPPFAHNNVVLEGGVPGRSSAVAAANVHLGPGDLHVAAHSG
ncbi:hypothetical protein P691DRAFT_790043 [Macrolepiota fuliginosa MF-IS2]|uniref:Uncharacterized protein n=1 Tax=Macrolepiota fuliginosa MF-IS2 TaxID=1400762 RepID=A0A9P5XEN4_9AGAR|nr:hypothetical protein P691DRAFT_790043 [Macrolepiota fuliginosa MF-IS2]